MNSSAPITLLETRKFDGIVWKTLVEPSSKSIFIETRDVDLKQVKFSCYSLETSQWLFVDFTFEEPWWISLNHVTSEVVLFTLYDDASNPEKKSLIVFDIRSKQVVWWKNQFAVGYVTDGKVVGTDLKLSREAIYNLHTGDPVGIAEDFNVVQNFQVIRPLQYLHGTPHFDTVSEFISRKSGLVPGQAIEYLEVDSLIIISAFVAENELANYLMVFNSEGEMVLKEQLGENLKGIAFDTFFVFAGCLIFVKNKKEWVSYKIA